MSGIGGARGRLLPFDYESEVEEMMNDAGWQPLWAKSTNWTRSKQAHVLS